MPNDSPQLRSTLNDILPHLVITDVAKTSGQRVVYFGYFDSKLAPAEFPLYIEWSDWGRVVVKVVAGIDANSLTYFQREIDILRDIDSEYYPRLLHSDSYNENPVTDEKLAERLFITVEEHIESLPLSACGDMFQHENEAVDLLASLCDALKLLWGHKNKIVHRDLKPDNLLIRPDGSVVIIDLGITRESGASGVTHTFFAHGPMTLRYASPEQANNDKRNITFKSDFFSLGIIIYELVAGINPFAPSPATSAQGILHNILNVDAVPLNQLRPVSPRFSALVSRLLEKQPFRRFRTVDDLMAELTAIKGERIGN